MRKALSRSKGICGEKTLAYFYWFTAVTGILRIWPTKMTEGDLMVSLFRS